VTHASRDEERRYAQLSPFELKTLLLSIASVATGGAGVAGVAGASGHSLLDAGRGNPNWVATTPREAFFLIGTFGMAESRRVWSAEGLGGMPESAGIALRLADFLHADPDAAGAALLAQIVAYGVGLGFAPDPWVHELVSGVIGDHYPGPDRMNVYAEQIVHRYLASELCADEIPAGSFDLFAVEGGTAAMCYIFDSLFTNRLLRRGDRVALMVPTFTPYLEIPRLDRYGFDIVEIHASACGADGSPTWQCPPDELAKLADPTVKALFVVNPSNPASVMMSASSIAALAQIVAGPNPDLIVVTDDVYGTFVPGFKSLMAYLPHNVIGVYSFSKYFGCTGWRLGVVAVHQENVVDRLLTELDEADRVELARRYRTISLEPATLAFIDRMVADSRQVALNHTAGLSLPQQVQMTLFAASALVDVDDHYQHATQAIVRHRLRKLYDGMELPLPDDPLRAGYYAEVDLMDWAARRYGRAFATWLADNYEPVDPIFRLAEQTSIVLLPGGGFDGPKWSVRVSLANLADDCYTEIGFGLRRIFNEYVDEYSARPDGRSEGVGHGAAP
jgi:aspartate 4-decarboxylase